MTSYSFFNYSVSPVTVIFPDNSSHLLAPNDDIADSSTSGDYTIGTYILKRSDLNKLATHSYYHVYITDNITVGKPVSSSTYKNGTNVNKVSDLSSDTWFILVSPSQSIALTNGTKDYSWIVMGSSHMLWILLILVIFFIVISVVGYFGYKTYKKKKQI